MKLSQRVTKRPNGAKRTVTPWRWLERPSEAAKVRNFTYFTDNSKL